MQIINYKIFKYKKVKFEKKRYYLSGRIKWF